MDEKKHFIETETANGWREGNIVHYIFKKNKIDLPEAIQAVELITELTQDEPVTYFIDISNVTSITKQARDHLETPYSSKKNNLGTAVLAPGIFSKLIGTFFIAFNKPKVNIKLFTNTDEALNWCHKCYRDHLEAIEKV